MSIGLFISLVGTKYAKDVKKLCHIFHGTLFHSRLHLERKGNNDDGIMVTLKIKFSGKRTWHRLV